MSNSRIIIIGCGNIGRRHLEGILKTFHNFEVVMVDKNPSALEIAREFTNSLPEHSNHVMFKTSLGQSSNRFDLAIIATTADARPGILRTLNQNIDVQNIIFEKLLAQSELELLLMQDSLKPVQGAWINYPRGSMQVYQDLQNQLNGERLKNVRITGESWNLVSNSMHFVDLIEKLNDDTLQSVDTSYLEKNWLEVRPGFYEVQGSLVCKFSKGDTLTLSCTQRSQTANDHGIHIYDEATDLNLRESNGIVKGKIGNRQIEGVFELQSELTGKLAKQIIYDHSSSLTTFNSGSKSFQIFLNALVSHWNLCFNSDIEKLEVT
jgi:hypothetical protein